MTERQLASLKKERSRLLDAWRIASPGQKNSILMRIADIDEDLEKYLPQKPAPKHRKFTKNNIHLLKKA